MNNIKQFIRKFIPKFIFSWYYFAWAFLAAILFRFPSNSLVVIGVTGTDGKTTTVNAIHWLLQSNGIRTGLISTANFKIGNREWVNNTKMTMLGRFSLQRLLRRMVKNKCKAAVIEVSSEGIVSHRSFGINFDILIFTNLSPEHIEAHGSFERYKRAKQRVFAALHKYRRKKLGFAPAVLRKTIIVNIDDEHCDDFLRFEADQKVGFGIERKESLLTTKMIRGSDVEQTKEGISFLLDVYDEKIKITSPLLGAVNTYNLLAAACVAWVFGFSEEEIKKGLESFPGVAGRMERITSRKGFDVIIDYALTPQSLERLYKTIRLLYKGKIIAVYGSCGGGRDKKKRPIMGQVVSGYADYSILTNEDPYFEDPYEIVRDIEKGYKENEKEKNKDYEIIINRDQAIEKALLMAQGEGDVVVITGKGSEAGMNVRGKIIPFNDKETVLKYLR